MNRLCITIEQLVASNNVMAKRLKLLESKLAGTTSSSNTSINTTATYRPLGTGSVDNSRPATSTRVVASYRLAFETVLLKTRVYRGAMRNDSTSATSLTSSERRTMGWSVLSGLSLAEVSNISVLSLPLYPGELYNPRWYASTTASSDSPAQYDPQDQDAPTPQSCGHIECDIFVAAKAGKSAMIHQWLLMGFNKDARNTSGDTLLHLAAGFGHEEIVRILLKHRCDTEAKNSGYMTALHVATYGGHNIIINLLVVSGASIDAKTHEDYTPLHLAVCKRRRSTVQLLLLLGADCEARIDNGFAPIHLAAGSLRTPMTGIVKTLLGGGADKEARTSEGLTALHLVVVASSQTTVDLLLHSGADIEATTKDGRTALHFAAVAGPGILMQLLDRGADFRAKASDGGTPLHLAAAAGVHWAAKVLLARGADVEARTNDGSSPLHLAAFNGRHRIVQLLLLRGADHDALTFSGCTPIQLAAVGENTIETMVPLVHWGSDTEGRAPDGSTLLHLAAAAGRPNIFKLLLHFGVDIEARTITGSTALHGAASAGKLSAVAQLLLCGADKGAITMDQKTPYHLALSAGHLEVASILLRYGTELDATVTGCNFHTARCGIIRGGDGRPAAIRLCCGVGITASDGSTPPQLAAVVV